MFFNKMEVIDKNNLSYEKKISNALKADRTVHRVTVNPNKASSREILNISVPKSMMELSWFLDL